MKDSDFSAYMQQHTPYKRLSESGYIAYATVFLVSDESDFINSENLILDGS
ncbi:MAG: SDR family oxidoreductase [Candidatus Natronoplasma sp.]